MFTLSAAALRRLLVVGVFALSFAGCDLFGGDDDDDADDDDDVSFVLPAERPADGAALLI